MGKTKIKIFIYSVSIYQCLKRKIKYMKEKFKYKSERLKILTKENVDNILNKYAERGYELAYIYDDIFIFKYRLETRGRKKSQ